MHSFWSKTLILVCTLCVVLAMTSSANAQSGTPELGVFEQYKVAPGATVQVPVSIRNVKDLYAVDFTLKFDPALLQVVDADPNTSGIQSSLGEFLDPGLLLFNLADNTQGTIHFVMSQYNPSEAKSGKGSLLLVNFQGVAEGVSPLEVISVTLSTREGVEIPSKGFNASLSISAGAPTQAATIPAAQATGLIPVYTFTPSPIPTMTPVPSQTPTPKKETPVVSTAAVSTGSGEQSQQKGYFLVDNWWILLVLLVIVIGVVYYLFGVRKKSKKEKGEG